MANTADHHLKVLIGDLVITVAKLAAENETLREQIPIPKPARKIKE